MWRKFTAIYVAAMALLAIVFWPATAGAAEISVQVNGQPLPLDVAPVLEEGRTLVPVRAIAEQLGAQVDWLPEQRRVEITLDERRLSLTIDNTIAYVDGVPKQLDVPARIILGRTLVPARFISESLYAEVRWDENLRLVSILTYENAAPFSEALLRMEGEVLQELNQRRAKLGREPLLAVEELTQMARGHGADMAKNNTFSHLSGRFGDTAARSSARGLKISHEYLLYGLPDAIAITDGLLAAEQGGRLLSAEARFFGLGLYQGATGGNADIYVVAELTEGEGFLLGPRTRRQDMPAFSVSGYAKNGAPLTIYQLDAQGQYLSRQSYLLSADSMGRFSFSFDLWQPGRYAAVLGQDSIILLYE